jgi:hypothetical protein
VFVNVSALLRLARFAVRMRVMLDFGVGKVGPKNLGMLTMKISVKESILAQ